jgi:hypothetical protein
MEKGETSMFNNALIYINTSTPRLCHIQGADVIRELRQEQEAIGPS